MANHNHMVLYRRNPIMRLPKATLLMRLPNAKLRYKVRLAIMILTFLSR